MGPPMGPTLGPLMARLMAPPIEDAMVWSLKAAKDWLLFCLGSMFKMAEREEVAARGGEKLSLLELPLIIHLSGPRLLLLFASSLRLVSKRLVWADRIRGGEVLVEVETLIEGEIFAWDEMLATTFSSPGEESLSTAAAAAVSWKRRLVRFQDFFINVIFSTSWAAALFLLMELENLSFLCSSDNTCPSSMPALMIIMLCVQLYMVMVMIWWWWWWWFGWWW